MTKSELRKIDLDIDKIQAELNSLNIHTENLTVIEKYILKLNYYIDLLKIKIDDKEKPLKLV